MRREVSCSLEFEVTDATEFVVALGPALGATLEFETLRLSVDGEPIGAEQQPEAHGTRLELFSSGPGILRIDYAAAVLGRSAAAVVDPLDAIVYLRPSRYVQSDTLTPFARETFPGLTGWPLARAVSAWVHDHLDYRPEATSPTGGAVETLKAGAGVCRDYAHLATALLRALDTPARVVAVYAPQLVPMDLHAVVEVLIDGRWVVIDPTRLAPRRGMVRISTGRDATDTAFVTNTLADVTLLTMRVEASADETFDDDPGEPVELG